VNGEVAIEVRCAGRGGRCGQLLAVAYTIPDRRPEGAVLHIVNAPWMRRKAGWPRHEARVPPEFSGTIDGLVVSCPKHPVWLVQNHAVPVSAEPMPCDILRAPYEQFLANRQRKAQLVKWLPRRREAVR
jgi:hypothetical protein